ncbi:MAG: 4-alpha-glucanotransferase [Deltaproteobacteria bacterium]|nr:4-alpha-glucanotransferase [Deltaproteobacteria bacterium]
MKIRSSGILLHISALPSPFGIGDMGPWAYQFVDFLATTKQSCWQILPLNPTESVRQHSPYHSTSAFAFNPLLISPELMIEEGLLSKKDIETPPGLSKKRVDFVKVEKYKKKLFKKAYKCFHDNKGNHEYEKFCSQNAYWLDDFSLFMALKSHLHGKTWNKWEQGLRDRDLEALQRSKRELSETIDRTKFLQYIFFKQWTSLKSYCNERGIQVIGDMPIYVQYNSTDLWAHPQYFKLDDKMRPFVVSGVPPDYFSKTGQLWGNPIYRWDALKENGYGWWIQRIVHNLSLFDLLRIDHFRGIVSCWEVPAKEKNAVNGTWVKGPAEKFLHVILKKIPHAPFIAEDLGFITPDVREILHRFEIPGMKVLLFAFGENQPTTTHAPHNISENCFIYTGTHDNNTARGWFETEATLETKKRLFRYMGRKITAKEVSWELVRLAMMSVANTAILPMQDILGLGKEARMNRPATREGNWQWRLLPAQLTSSVQARLLEITEIYGRG